MNRQDDWVAPCTSGAEASSTAMILPTDIMLGRGPTCYNNPGNRVFRKMVKEHVIHYKNHARRKEKAGLVTLLISKLQAKGYRFLHRSSAGEWVEAPSKIAEKKVGHGLRDARLAVTKTGGDGPVLPKNFRPAVTEKNSGDQETPFSSEKSKPKQKRCTKKSGKAEIKVVRKFLHCDVLPPTLQNSLNDAMVSSKALASYLQQDATTTNLLSTRQMEPKILDVKVPILPSELLLDVASLNQNPLPDFERQKAGLPLFDYESEGALWDVNNTGTLADFSASCSATQDSHLMDAVVVALNMYDKSEHSFDDFFADDAIQPPGGAVYDGRSLCDWFSNL